MSTCFSFPKQGRMTCRRKSPTCKFPYFQKLLLWCDSAVWTSDKEEKPNGTSLNYRHVDDRKWVSGLLLQHGVMTSEHWAQEWHQKTVSERNVYISIQSRRWKGSAAFVSTTKYFKSGLPLLHFYLALLIHIFFFVHYIVFSLFLASFLTLYYPVKFGLRFVVYFFIMCSLLFLCLSFFVCIFPW
jgi:hypothetical protein